MSSENKIKQSEEVYVAIAIALYDVATNLLGEIHAAIAITMYDSGKKMSEEEFAAITMALFDSGKSGSYKCEYHDKESMVLTIKRTAQIYSPWNLKINSIKELPIIKRNNGIF